MRCIIYHLFGYKNCLETLVLLSLKDFESKELLNRNVLKARYKKFLSQLQPNIPVSKSIGIELVNDFEKSQKFIQCFNINLEKEGIPQLVNINSNSEDSISSIKYHLEVFSKIDPQLHSLFFLAINIIFCGDSSHAVGGTTSDAIGVVWGNPEKEWNVCDYLEYFVHELTHTLMFLDELRFLHYQNQKILYDAENFSISAILQAERPFDRVLHSIVVATEILIFRSLNLVDHSECQIHPATEKLVESTLYAAERLFLHPNRDDILTIRSLQILDECKNAISKNFISTF